VAPLVTQRTTLGRTGLDVSVAGLGCGGHSRLGQSYGATDAESIAVVHRALDLGINLVDTARLYGTEDIVGRALVGHRDEVVLSTKALPVDGAQPISAAGLRASVEKSLGRLRTDRVDLFFIHGMKVSDVDHTRDVLVPELLSLREAGKIRFLAVSEAFASDNGHDALGQSLDAGDDWYDVLMVGHNPFNPSARDRVLAATEARGIGVLVMFAVRKALASPDGVRRVVADLIDRGEVDPQLLDPEDPLGFLLDDGASASLSEAAYRFARHEPGCHVVLTGTGSVAHLEENVASINAPPLPDDHLARLELLFGHLDCVTGD
jgi:L-galactose dehydrogenase